MLIGYVRTSTVEQQAGFDAQIVELKKAGCERLFQEQVSSVALRPELDAAIDFSREGDTFVVTKLDRLARSVAHLVEIATRLQTKKVALRILAMGIDTSTATGRMMFNIIGSIAQFEREMMLERQREGIAKAKSEGRYKGRPQSIDRAKVRELLTRMGPAEVAKTLGVARSSIYRMAPPRR